MVYKRKLIYGETNCSELCVSSFRDSVLHGNKALSFTKQTG